MRRGLWFAAGAGAGVWAAVRARRLAEAVTPDGLRDRVGAAWVGAGILRDEMAQGMADAESELRERYGPASHGSHELEPGGRPQLPHHPRPQHPEQHPDPRRGTP